MLNTLDAAVLPIIAATIVVFVAFVWIIWFGREGGRALDFRDHDDKDRDRS